MKQTPFFWLLSVIVSCLFLSLIGCGDKTTTDESVTAQAQQAAPAASDQPASAKNSGKLLETMDSGNYTYVLLDMDGKEVWAAGPTTTGLEVGQEIYLKGSMEMKNFHSKTLDRTFESILFAGGISTDATAASAPAHGMGHNNPMAQAANPISGTKTRLANAHVEGIAKVDGGYTVAEVYAQAADLAGKEITLRGQVVKFSPEIMGTNWLHVQDGTGGDTTSDLTVTTKGFAKVGDVVLITGPLSVDKDFGAGYRYDVIVEDAKVTKE